MPEDRPASDGALERLMREQIDEMSLVAMPREGEAYRFNRQVAFSGAVTVSISRLGDRVTLAARSRLEFYGPEQQVFKRLTAADWDHLQRALHLADFWALPVSHERTGFDGEDWTIEGRRDARYHRSECWCPDSGAYHDLGCLFLELAGFDMPDDDP